MVDILLVAALIFWLLYLIRGTRTFQLLRGIILIFVVASVSGRLKLTALSWLVRNAIPALLVAIPVIFQPELRRALGRLGEAGHLLNWPSRTTSPSQLIDILVRACQRLSERQHGALIVLEQEVGLQDVIDTGVKIDAELSEELLLSIFFPDSSLHDQAVVIRGDRVVAARCLLPLAETWPEDQGLGTRHRAAVGLTEGSDAIVLVISEETGIVSVAHHGRLIRRLDEGRLRRLLHALYEPQMLERLPRFFQQGAK